MNELFHNLLDLLKQQVLMTKRHELERKAWSEKVDEVTKEALKEREVWEGERPIRKGNKGG